LDSKLKDKIFCTERWQAFPDFNLLPELTKQHKQQHRKNLRLVQPCLILWPQT